MRHFTQGQAAFNCSTCGRLTRITSQPRDYPDCAHCYDLAGLENMVWDGNAEPRDMAERDRLLKDIEGKGGNPAKVRAAFGDLFADDITE